MRRHLVLIGYRGAGKTSVGKILADRIGLPFVDVDHEVAMKERTPIAEIFFQRGEAAFRVAEAREIAMLLERPLSIVAIGGGALKRQDNQRILKRTGYLVWLDASIRTLVHRLELQAPKRPLLAGDSYEEEIRILLPEREKLYRRMADLQMDSGRGTPKQIAERLLGKLPAEWKARDRKK